MRKVSFFSVVVLLLAQVAFAQSPSPVQVNKKVPVTGSENFDFLFTRSVLAGSVDSVNFASSRSGATSIGIGYGLPVGKTLLLKFEPRVTWHKLYFSDRSSGKWFPSNDTSATLVFEKQRVSYLEVPVSLKFKLARNNVERYKLLLEAGFVFGLKLTSSSKTRQFSGVNASGTLQGPVITTKVSSIDDLSRFRFGPFVRLGTNWLSIYGFYRMSDVYRPYRKFSLPDGSSRAYPNFPRLEFGITVAI